MKKISSALASVVAAYFLLSCPCAEAAGYRFDDVYELTGAGAQWVVIASDDNTIGASFKVTASAYADIVRSPDRIYLLNRNATSPDAIDTMFSVIPGTGGAMRFDLASPMDVQDVKFDFGGRYNVTARPLTEAPVKSWDITFSKISGASLYETVVGTMIIHQGRAAESTQTLQIPFIIANVFNGSAESAPLEFSTIIRESYSGASGDIVANDRFAWDVRSALSVGDENSDWLFVPLNDYNIDANVVNYTLLTDIKNYSGIRYGLHRYDMLGTTLRMQPKKWTMEIPTMSGKASKRAVSLDLLSHIAPGLTTSYEQPFNVISEGSRIFQIYPINPASVFQDLNLWHPSVFGLDLEKINGPGCVVNAFELMPSDTGFLEKISKSNGLENAAMPNLTDAKIPSFDVSFANIGRDAINSFAVEAGLPERLMRSNDATALLPLHITLDIPYSNRLLMPEWESLWNEWNRSGNIKDLFADSFRIFARDSNAKNYDLTDWLQKKGLYNKLVKVFVDDDKSLVTVSFITILVDASDAGMFTVRDSSLSVDNEYLVIKDGKRDDKWGLAFFVAPKGYVPTDGSGGGGDDGGGGGGGCDAAAGAPFALSLLFASAARKLKRGR